MLRMLFNVFSNVILACAHVFEWMVINILSTISNTIVKIYRVICSSQPSKQSTSLGKKLSNVDVIKIRIQTMGQSSSQPSTLYFYSTHNSPMINYFICFSHNRSVSDGRSGCILINDFLTLATTPNLLEVSEPLNTKILPLIGPLIPRPYGCLFGMMSFIGRQVFKRLILQMTRPRIPVKVTPLTNCNPTKSHMQRYKIKFLFTSSSSNLYSKLHEQCRRHEITLNSPLFGCLLLAIHHYFPLDDNTRLKPFGIGVSFDMGSRLPQSPLTSSSVGFFVGTGEFELKGSLSIRSTHFWSLARECMTITQNQLKRNGVPLTMNIFADILGNQRDLDQFGQLFPQGRESEFAFSNMGKYSFSCKYNQGEVQLRGLHFINNASVYRTSSAVYVTCAGDGQLDFALAHEMASDEIANNFLDYYLRLIDICTDSERCKADTTLDQLLQMAASQ